MKFDFTYYNPTKIYFGKNSLDNLARELSNYGKNILLMYGKGSVKKSGLYDKVIDILKKANKNVVELAGIKSNPSYSQLLEGARLVRENNVDLILAVGGGSVIDCAKRAGRKKNIPEELLEPIEDVSIPDCNSPEKIFFDKEAYKALTHSIKLELSGMELAVLQLFLSGKKYIDIADELGVSEKSVNNALMRIRRKLKDKQGN